MGGVSSQQLPFLGLILAPGESPLKAQIGAVGGRLIGMGKEQEGTKKINW
jgi:hypothetical protein